MSGWGYGRVARGWRADEGLWRDDDGLWRVARGCRLSFQKKSLERVRMGVGVEGEGEDGKGTDVMRPGEETKEAEEGEMGLVERRVKIREKFYYYFPLVSLGVRNQEIFLYTSAFIL